MAAVVSTSGVGEGLHCSSRPSFPRWSGRSLLAMDGIISVVRCTLYRLVLDTSALLLSGFAKRCLVHRHGTASATHAPKQAA